MQAQNNEARIILAIEAIQNAKKLSCLAASKLYNIPEPTGRPSHSNTRPKSHKLNILEEEVIIRYIIDLDTRGFGPWLAGVEDIANHLLEAQGGKHVRKL